MAGGEPGGAGSSRPAHVSRARSSQNLPRPGRPRPLSPAPLLARRDDRGDRAEVALPPGRPLPALEIALPAEPCRCRDAVYRPPQTLPVSFLV